MNTPARFVRLPLSVQDDTALGPLDIAVFLAIARYSNVEGIAYPSVERISSISHVGKTRVSKSIATLRDRRHIAVESGRREGNRRAVNQYRILGFTFQASRGECSPDERTNDERSRIEGFQASRGEQELELRELDNTTYSPLRGESEEKDEKPKDNIPTSSLFSDPSPPSSARPPLPGSSEPAPRKRKRNKVAPELLPLYHEIEAKLQEAAKARGITWQFPKESPALARLVKVYENRSEELGPLVDTWINLTASEVRFLGGKPPTASMLFSLLSQVEAEHVKRKPRPGLTLLRTCPVCGAQLPQGGQYCATCRTLAEDFGNPEAVAKAKSRREALV